jgi:hypothetical protein
LLLGFGVKPNVVANAQPFPLKTGCRRLARHCRPNVSSLCHKIVMASQCFTSTLRRVDSARGVGLRVFIFISNIGAFTMHKYLLALSATAALASAPALAGNSGDGGGRGKVPDLDHVLVVVLENHNAFTSFGSEGIIGNPNAPHITALAQKYNLASNYNGAWHPSLPNYLAMITGNFIGTDVVATGHTYPPGSVVGISDDDSPSVATDYPVPPANASIHRWKVQLPSLAGQLVSHGKDWRAYLQNIPDAGTTLANWPGDNNTAKLYAVKHNPFPYVEEVQNDPAQFAKQVPIEQLFSDLGAGTAPAFSYIVPDQCRDMHGIGNVLAPCGGVNDTDANDVKRGDDETFWLINGIMGSKTWSKGRNALFIVFDEGNGPLTCN